MVSKKLFLIGLLFLLALPLSLALIQVGDGDSGTIIVGPSDGGINVGPVYEDPCGNGIIDYPEQCDGLALGGQTCLSLGYNSGSLSCKSNCVYDNNCYNSVVDNPPSGGDNSGSGGGGGSSSSSSSSSSAAGCTENWECSEWEVCEDGKQERECSDKNNCGTISLKPALIRDCNATEEDFTNSQLQQNGKGFFSRLTGAVIGGGSAALLGVLMFIVIVVLVAILVYMKKNKNRLSGK